MGKLVREITAMNFNSQNLEDCAKSSRPHLIKGEISSIHGRIEGNADFLEPVFYLSSELGDEPASYVASLIGDDEMFFFPSQSEAGQDYNYNENSSLAQAIRSGYRGAFWDILRRRWN